MQRAIIDISGIEGTYCYCSNESALQVRRMVSEIPLEAVHLLGTGDYHYLSLMFLERIRTDFSLVLFDNHPDDQSGAFDEGLLTCGSWVKAARENIPMLKSYFRNDIDGIPSNLPVYLSVDLDVLSPEYARTDWDQGEMSLPELLKKVESIKSTHKILGVDICGGLKNPSQEDLSINGSAIDAICGLFND